MPARLSVVSPRSRTASKPTKPFRGVRGPVRVIIFEESKARSPCEGKALSSIPPSLLFRIEFELKILFPEKKGGGGGGGKKETEKWTTRGLIIFLSPNGISRNEHRWTDFYLPSSGINTTFPCYRSYEIGLEIGGGMQGRRNAKFAPGERREGWW